MFDVAIIGYGPTGATLANLLAVKGIKVVVLDREAEIYPLPRAVHFDDETMRVFQQAGIADTLAEQVIVNPGMRFVGLDGELLLDWPRPQTVTDQGWHASYRLYQPDLERLLRQQVASRAEVTVLAPVRAVQLTQHHEHVTVDVEAVDSGQQQQLEARYVVGCDGANSMVRNFLESAMLDLGFRERWLVVDVVLKQPRDDLGDHTVQFCNPERPMTYCRSPGSRRRWEIAILDHEPDASMIDPERIWSLLSRWITPQDATLERQAVYTFQSSIAKLWQHDRVMIAGDAAHLTPPFMGQGMCAGIRDAMNLAWKLAHCLETDNSILLETYQSERFAHVQAYIETAIRLGKLINSLDRASALELGQQQNTGHSQMKSIAPCLGTSSLALPDNSTHDWVGRPFPQPTLDNGTRLDDATGYHPLLITCRSPAAIAANIPSGVAHFASRDFPSIEKILSEQQLQAVLIRPDKYVQAVAATNTELDALLELATTTYSPNNTD